LFPDAGNKQGHRRQVEPGWASIHREAQAQARHVYRYSRFCELYRIWEGRLSVTMRQTHVGGDKLFVELCRRHGAGDRRPADRRGAYSVSAGGDCDYGYALKAPYFNRWRG
jgi:transposase